MRTQNTDTQKEFWKGALLLTGLASLFLFMTFFGHDDESEKKQSQNTNNKKLHSNIRTPNSNNNNKKTFHTTFIPDTKSPPSTPKPAIRPRSASFIDSSLLRVCTPCYYLSYR